MQAGDSGLSLSILLTSTLILSRTPRQPDRGGSLGPFQKQLEPRAFLGFVRRSAASERCHTGGEQRRSGSKRTHGFNPAKKAAGSFGHSLAFLHGMRAV